MLLPNKPIFIEEAFMYNLVSNLAENARYAGAKRMVNDYWTDSEFFFMSFQDNGNGMTEEVRNRCLEMGFTTKPNGSGIGLGYLNKEVLASGGRVEVASKPKKGTTITIIQPIELFYPYRKVIG